MKTLTFDGEVVTGEGNGKKYLAILWVKQQIEEKLGFTPFLGTLNIKLTKGSTRQKKRLEKTKSTTIFPAEGYCYGFIFKAAIGNIDCAVVLPEVEGYRENVLEVISAVNLREALNLRTGDNVSVTVYI